MTERSAMNPLDTVRAMTATRRFVVLGAAAAALVGIWMVSRWATAPTFVPLYHDMELSEVGKVTDHLTKVDIAYRLGGGGTELQVPAEDLARARVALARDGLAVMGRPGLELFDKPSWGMTEFTQRVTYQRALEGELSRTIGGLRGVREAQIHLVMPRTSSFRQQNQTAGASVVLTLAPGASIAPETVRGITYIVANSVEQLSSDNVAVLDDGGHLLSAPAANTSISGLTSRQLEIQQGVEQHLANKVEQLLTTVVGNGRARAQVAAQLNFEQVDRTIESFDPEGQVVETEQRSETGTGAATDAGSQTVISNSYLNSRRMERIVGAVGGVTRLTVAVLVDERALQSSDLAQGGVDNRLASIEAMVRDAIGIDETRNDRLTVTAIPFEPVTVTDDPLVGTMVPPSGPTRLLEIAQQLSRPLIALTAIVALLLLAWRVLRTVPALPRAGEATQESLTGGSAGRPDLEPGAEPSPAALIQRRLQTVAADRPELTAQVVRTWLTESR